jgi:uncharacterized protein YgiM (DUF1202 family)
VDIYARLQPPCTSQMVVLVLQSTSPPSAALLLHPRCVRFEELDIIGTSQAEPSDQVQQSGAEVHAVELAAASHADEGEVAQLKKGLSRAEQQMDQQRIELQQAHQQMDQQRIELQQAHQQMDQQRIELQQAHQQLKAAEEAEASSESEREDELDDLLSKAVNQSLEEMQARHEKQVCLAARPASPNNESMSL